MTGEQFTAFLDHMEWNDSEAARRLGKSRNSIAKYKNEGAGDDLDYACAAFASGLPRWSEGMPDGLAASTSGNVAVSRDTLEKLAQLVADLTKD